MCQANIAQCPQCGKQPSKDKTFCSKECYWESMRAGNYNRGTTRNYPCVNCGKIVSGRTKGKTRSGKRSDKIFCGRPCYDEYRAEKIRARTPSCLNCGDTIKKRCPEKYKYCTLACKIAHKRPEPVTCIQCKAVFTAIKWTRRDSGLKITFVSSAKTCSAECLEEFYRTNKARKEKISKAFRAEKHPNWQGGSHYGCTRGPGWQRIAEECRERCGRKCGHCGMTEEQSKAKGWGRLQVNHIVPFWQWQDKQKANRQSNLEALCKSCHTKADWQWRKNNPVQMTLNVFR